MTKNEQIEKLARAIERQERAHKVVHKVLIPAIELLQAGRGESCLAEILGFAVEEIKSAEDYEAMAEIYQLLQNAKVKE